MLGPRFVSTPPAIREGEPADLILIDRSATWQVSPEALASKGKNTPLLGRELRGRVLVTIADGRVAFEA